jgi:hypothetical protein
MRVDRSVEPLLEASSKRWMNSFMHWAEDFQIRSQFSIFLLVGGGGDFSIFNSNLILIKKIPFKFKKFTYIY